MVDLNLIVAIVIGIVVVIATIVLAFRFGFGMSAKFVMSIMASPVIMEAFKSLEKSVPPEVLSTVLGVLDLGEATTPNADLKALLDAIEELIKQSKQTQTLLAGQPEFVNQLIAKGTPPEAGSDTVG